MTHESVLPPGHTWFEIIKRPTLAAFASAFAEHAELHASVASGPVIGAAAIRHFFCATRTMYDTIAFVRETRHSGPK
jgi:hypothetical protein